MISVEDEGRGIPAELRERVFDKFFRATSEGAASLGRPRGLGLGLAMDSGTAPDFTQSLSNPVELQPSARTIISLMRKLDVAIPPVVFTNSL
jgi:K+-sensing histidine kinase KdpD